MTTRCRRPPTIIPKVPHLVAADRVAIVGVTGTGKSTCAKALLEREGAHWPIIAFDPDDEYSRRGIRRAEVVLGPLRDRVTWDEYLALPDDALDDPRLSLAVVPDEDPEEAAAQLTELVADIRNTGGMLVLVEELGGFAAHAQQVLNLLATRSRKWGVRRGCPLVLVTQRLSQIPITARAQLSIVETFRQTETADHRALTERCGQDIADRARALPRGESLLWAPTHQESPS